MAQGQATFELSAKPTKSLLGTSLQLQGLLYTLIFTEHNRSDRINKLVSQSFT